MLRILSYLLIFSCVMTAALPDAVAKKYKKSKGNPKYASIVMDADSGMILSQRYADKSLHPASLTKMMTMLLMFEAIDRGDIRKNSRIRISQKAASMQPSKLGLPAGSSIKVEDAIYVLATKSANDIAVAVAEYLGKSERRFAAMMTERARTIGMNKTRFRNASGLHHKYQVSTARDMAKLARYILHRYPHYYSYFSTKNFTYKGKTYRNHNRLMSSYKGMDGFKTGYINASGFNLVASAYRDGRRLIGVVFGGQTSKSRNKHMAKIMDAGFKKAGRVRIASVKNPPIPQQKPTYGLASLSGQVHKPTTPIKNNNKGSYTSLAALNNNIKIKTPAADHNVSPNYTALTKALQEGAFGEMIGEGDIDPATSKRLETGLIAVAMHKGDYKSHMTPSTKTVETNPKDKMMGLSHIEPAAAPENSKINAGKWAVQIGAYTNYQATNKALQKAKRKLPDNLQQARALMVPLKTAQGTIYRARLGDFNEKEARKACRYINDCMVIAPFATQASVN